VSLLSRAVARVAKLDMPLTRKVRLERDLRVPMTDGVDLLADRYAPAGGDRLPLVLFGEIFAQRGDVEGDRGPCVAPADVRPGRP
jgi:predicted acyl esterase